MNNEPQKIQLQHGYYFSPGFYMDYWQNAILNNFDGNVVAFHGKLKQHREMWIGAHLAALKTKLSGNKYYASLPEHDPPDVLIGTFAKINTKSGRTGHNIDWYPVEITRCDASAGEDLLNQIKNKNKYAYTNTILVVYLQGAEVVPDLSKLSKTIQSLSKVYLHEIIIMVQLKGTENAIPNNTFGFVQVFPNYDTMLINRDDSDAFFTEPNMMRITGRGVQDKAENLGSIMLMAPEI